MITHLCHVSALVAHYFRQPGADVVNQILAASDNQVGISALGLFEFRAHLQQAVSDPKEAERAYNLYANELLTALPVTPGVVERARLLQTNSPSPLPRDEAIEAALAQSERAILVHRHEALARLAPGSLSQLALPS